jgi:hypothetical protein
MTNDSVIYTDGHHVKVTTYQFIAGETKYFIDGILSVRMNYIKAKIIPAIVLIVLGLAAVVAGFLHLFNTIQLDNLRIGTMTLTANRLAAIIGVVLILIGLISMAVRHRKYAVHILTADGEKEPVVSTKKDYIYQIVSAIEKAIEIVRPEKREVNVQPIRTDRS